MWKKVIKFYVFAGLISIIAISCCEQFFEITDELFTGFYNTDDPFRFLDENTDTITSAFGYRFEARVEQVGIDLSEWSLINSTLATSCEDIYTRNFVDGSGEIVVDRSFFIDSLEIPAGTNLMQLGLFLNENGIELSRAEFLPRAFENLISIEFPDTLLPRLTFPLDTYTFTTNVEVSDSTNLRAVQRIVISIH